MAAATSREWRSAPLSFLTQPRNGTTSSALRRTAPTAAPSAAVVPRSMRPASCGSAGASRSAPSASSSACTSAASDAQPASAGIA